MPSVVEPSRPPGATGGLVLAAVAVGGALGTLARYGVDLLLPVEAGRFPTGTFLVNLVGCLLVGALAGVVYRARAHPLLLPFVVTGLLGGFTTFSTYTVQAVDLALRGAVGTATWYLIVTLLAALVAVEAGLIAGRGAAEWSRRRSAVLNR